MSLRICSPVPRGGAARRKPRGRPLYSPGVYFSALRFFISDFALGSPSAIRWRALVLPQRPTGRPSRSALLETVQPTWLVLIILSKRR